MTVQPPRLLFIDSYDSFTFNLASACRRWIPGCIIYIIKNDFLSIKELLPYLGRFSAIIVGPGPGSPDNPHDIGIVKDIWKIADIDLLPVFGVCLGLQSLGVEFGARLRRLNVVKHGQVSTVHHHAGADLFEGKGPFAAVRYHSLHIDLDKDSELEELAWTDDGEDNGRVVMAAKHRTRPFWAVQYHPESVCTQRRGVEVLPNFWKLAQEWTRLHKRTLRAWDASCKQIFGNPWPTISSPSSSLSLSFQMVNTKILDLPGLGVTAVAELLGALEEEKPFIMLDSAASPGRFSIVSALLPTSLQITHNVGDTYLTLKRGTTWVREEFGGNDVWSWIATFMENHRFSGSPEIPFWGGFVGQLSYELGVQSLQVGLKPDTNRHSRHPDVNLVFVERSVVLDSISGKVYIQSILPGDDVWVSETASRLIKIRPNSSTPTPTKITAPNIKLPDKTRYIARIDQAKDRLFAGDSYELCLTANTRITIPDCSSTTPTSWDRYKMLRQRNPAPHSAFLRLHPSTFLSSSPERFLSYSRPPHSTCQLRPIKGTVKKAEGITRAVAEELLAGSKKEVAENLMIVDLIRHDLHGVVGELVEVKQFCAVEEYETVWQLVSVIEGRLEDNSVANPHSQIGWEVLRQSLPPGSMTGAPKKRSVEILQSLEDEERNLYSGVFGYWCVGGGGDWSVAIRSCFKYGHPPSHAPGANVPSSWTEEWTVGAGGAITALSDPEAEWDEMLLKLQSFATPAKTPLNLVFLYFIEL
ncbi:hypothetical protein H0H92_002116 [Tricholoma furcatifolium]|nr:hypothetical protein H0H92_002116 [Tricholoma furcatifolium]